MLSLSREIGFCWRTSGQGSPAGRRGGGEGASSPPAAGCRGSVRRNNLLSLSETDRGKRKKQQTRKKGESFG